jgi:hypothetical protein
MRFLRPGTSSWSRSTESASLTGQSLGVSRTFGQIQLELTSFAKANSLPGVDLELVRGWINEAYNDVLDHRDWKRLESRAILQTTAAYRTGTVTVTNGSTSVTGSGTTFPNSTGLRFRVAGRNESYSFSYVSATSGTLDRGYEGDTAAGAGFEIFRNIYQLGARVKLISLMRNPRTNQPMERITEENLDQASAARLSIGEPYFYSPSTDSGDPPGAVSQVEIYPAPEYSIGLPYSYVRLPIEFTGANTDAQIMDWVDPRTVIAGAKAIMLSHFKLYLESQAEEGIGRRMVDKMSQVETAAVGPSRIRMATRYTKHRHNRGQWGAQ